MDRELDERIARALGWECHMVGVNVHNGESVGEFQCENYGKFCAHHCPEYSSSWEAMGELLAAVPGRVVLIRSESGKRPCKAYFMRTDEEGYPFSYSETTPLAVARAALSALDARGEK